MAPFGSAQGATCAKIESTRWLSGVEASIAEASISQGEANAMPYMYILECSDGSYYTGSTWNLVLRLQQHQQGVGANHTAKRLPVKLVYFEQTDRIDDAFYREKQVQGWSRKKKQALIAGDTNALHELAVCSNETSHEFAPFDSAQGANGA